jgi:hypothetical protein
MYGLVSFEHSPVVSQNGTIHPRYPIFPLSNSFRINRLYGFADAPPHVSPLKSCGCRKQGWVGGAPLAFAICASRRFWPGPVPSDEKRRGSKYKCFLSLTNKLENDAKKPQCFLSLTSLLSRKYLSFLSLTKKRRGEGYPGLSLSVPSIGIPSSATRGVAVRNYTRGRSD